MKMFKRLTAFAAAGILGMTALVGCGSGEDFYKGKWVPIEMTEGDTTIKAADAEEALGMKLEDYMSMELKDDNKVVLTIEGETDETATWKMDGDEAVIEANGESSAVKKDGDNIIFEPQDGVSIKLEKK